MAGQARNDDLALAARIAQKLTAPSEAIIGFLSLLTEEVRRSGPQDALADLDKVSVAAGRLGHIVRALGSGGRTLSDDAEAQAKLRHDLRSPINAIIGYAEMVVEDFEQDLPPSALRDIETILNEARRLVVQIDVVVDGAVEADAGETVRADAAIAENLARSLSEPVHARETLTGHILVIDDEAPNREILTRQLARQGHTVTAVGSAAETFDALAGAKFDLILLDILMPDINGIEVLEQIKADPALKEIPVVMVSGLTETGAIAKCISIGAEDYLPKPIDPVLLHARVNACLERMQWRAREVAFTNEIRYEKDRADVLLHAMLPAPVILRLNNGETQIADRFPAATIIFADIVDFTPLVARMDAGDLVQQLSSLFTAFDGLVNLHGIEKIKTIGDAYMAASGIPSSRNDHAHAAVNFARDMIKITMDQTISAAGFRIRVGIHSGPVIAGLIGRKRSVYDVWGETVNLASRLESTGTPGRIQISEATLTALGAHAGETEARDHVVKGVGSITSYFIT